EAIKVGSKEEVKAEGKVRKVVSKKKKVEAKGSAEEVKALKKPQLWMDVQEHDRLAMKKLLEREERWMDTAREPKTKALMTAMLPPMEDMEVKKLIKEERRSYLDGYYEGYKAGLMENKTGKDDEMLKSAVTRLSKQEDNMKNRAYKIGFIEGYNRARMLKTSHKEKSVIQAIEQLTAKGISERTRRAEGVSLTDGTNVIAKTPGGSEPILIDPKQRGDIVHIARTGKRQFLIVMYRDPVVPENLVSRSGDDEDSNSPGSHQNTGKPQPPK
ncbi:hypothetical protein OSTOST_21098, partial [Ostertagia ostertagi]